MTGQNDRLLLRIGAVSYLNTQPLIEGLDAVDGVSLTRAVPSALPDMLDAGQIDVGLVPIIDTVRDERAWKICSDACIGCDGATLTVRVYARVDAGDIDTIFVDGDSHTSVVLAQVLWRERFGRPVTVVPLADAIPAELRPSDAILLIGDKVISPPMGMDLYSTQIDLGAMWKSLTGLPFVFAVWACGESDVANSATPILNAARDRGVAIAGQLARENGPRHGWPEALAEYYLTKSLNFTLTDRHREAMTRFIELARKYELVSMHQELVFA